MGRPSTKRDEAGRPMIVPAFGPAIPLIPRADFTRGFTEAQCREAWSVVGPSVMVNMGQNLPLWMIMAACYLEGMLHMHGIMQERDPTSQYREVLVKAKGKKP